MIWLSLWASTKSPGDVVGKTRNAEKASKPRASFGWRTREAVTQWIDGVSEWFETPRKVLKTLPSDGVPWAVDSAPQRVVAIGDVHGDLVGLVSILLDRGLIDDEGNWCAQQTHLVLNGDLFGRHSDARLLYDFVMRLEEQATQAGGTIHSLLGNHDVLAAGYNNPFRGDDRKLFQRYAVRGAADYRDAFRGQTTYAKWLRSRNTIVRIGETLFVHAGLGEWAFEQEPGRINATVREWIRYWQRLAPKPDPHTQWVVGKPGMRRGSFWEIGPIWTRVFKVDYESKSEISKDRTDGAPKRKTFLEILGTYRAKRMVIGHAPIDHKRIVLAHPYYGEAVVMIDTRISDQENGQLSCIEILSGQLTAHYMTRHKCAKRIRQRQLELLKASGLLGVWKRLQGLFR